jgi:saccharopine dehydrogenase-like NADP-dependent oxidoreductase
MMMGMMLESHKVLVVGAGRVGRSIAHMLCAEPNYRVRICDIDPKAAQKVANEIMNPKDKKSVAGQVEVLEKTSKDARGTADAFAEPALDLASLKKAMAGRQAVISAAPFSANKVIAQACKESGVHYLDLTEDVAVTKHVRELSKDPSNSAAFVPQCGVAPGFITLAATHMVNQFDKVDHLSLKVGALPRQVHNRLRYNLSWSTAGLVNEYIHPCEALRGGKLVSLQVNCPFLVV